MASDQRQLPIILALGTTQTLAWASSYYLPAILADPIARDLGVSSNWIFAAFSASLVISAVLGPRVGRQIDLVGGRSVLSISNLTLAAGLALLGATFMVTGAITDSIYALLAGRARRFFSGPRTRLVSRVSGGFMIGGGLWLALTRAR